MSDSLRFALVFSPAILTGVLTLVESFLYLTLNPWYVRTFSRHQVELEPVGHPLSEGDSMRDQFVLDTDSGLTLLRRKHGLENRLYFFGQMSGACDGDVWQRQLRWGVGPLAPLLGPLLVPPVFGAVAGIPLAALAGLVIGISVAAFWWVLLHAVGRAVVARYFLELDTEG